jgi:hypothetical protein
VLKHPGTTATREYLVTNATIDRTTAGIKGRVLRGLELYRTRGEEIVTMPYGGYSVPSATLEDRSYRVCVLSGRCGCEDHRRTSRACLHIYAATIAEAKGR